MAEQCRREKRGLQRPVWREMWHSSNLGQERWSSEGRLNNKGFIKGAKTEASGRTVKVLLMKHGEDFPCKDLVVNPGALLAIRVVYGELSGLYTALIIGV